jgi:aldose 1-epimerase
MQAAISRSPYGKLPDGSVIDCFTLSNGAGITAKLLTLGATLAELHAPDRSGRTADITLGFDDLAGWLEPKNPYMGCVVGRYANRIANGRFTLEGKCYQLAVNNGACSLHGGLRGFDKMVWKAREMTTDDGVAVEFSHTSPDGDEGYPGRLALKITYTLTAASELRLDYFAETDQPTVLNLTNHAYWNLAGEGTVLNHVARIASSRITEVEGESIPTGRLIPVKGTPFDFTSPATIGSRLDQIGNRPAGYDHNYVLESDANGRPALAARIEDPASGRVLEVLTTEPGMQFYTGNYLDGSLTGKGGRNYRQHEGFCLETQHFPDSPNHPQFPSTTLRPGEQYRQTTIHRFSTVS